MKLNIKNLFGIILIVLIIGGLCFLASASTIIGREQHHDSLFFVKDQLIKGLALGLIAFFILSKINLKFLRKFSFLFYIFNLFLLALVFFKPFIPKGEITARRWVDIFGFSFQPSELLKISLILFVADFLSRKSSRDLSSWTKTILPLVVVLGIPMALIYFQPATSIIALFLAAVGAMCFTTKMSFKIISVLTLLAVVLVSVMIAFGGNYRKDRITNEDDYQRRQSIIGIVRGGVMGVGFGQSRQKYNFLPQSYTDSIYAVIAEEFGFIGTIIILVIYFSIFFLGFYVAARISDPFSSLFIVGTTTWITVQALYHIMCMSIEYMPITGLPLPLISHGGTSYAITMASLGIFYNILNNKM